MRRFIKILSLTIAMVIVLHSIKNAVYASPNVIDKNPVRAAVFINNFNDPFFYNVMKNLEEVQKENGDKIQFTFFDSKGNQSIQNALIDQELNNNFDLFVVNPVSTKINDIGNILNKISQSNIPLIIDTPPNLSLSNYIRPYGKAVIIGSDDVQSGILQGKILVDIWNSNKKNIDKNKDNIMQYIMLKGPSDSQAAVARSKYSIQTINEAGIKTQELLSIACNWDKECARTTMESTLLNLIDKIEVIISNNDAMAIGAIEALQKYGYNKGANSKYIPVVGVDALPEAKELIKQGAMAGTVIQDPRSHADAIYAIGMNLVSETNPLANTNYKFDESGNTIKLPYYPFTK